MLAILWKATVTSGDWHTPANWDGGVVPTDASDVEFPEHSHQNPIVVTISADTDATPNVTEVTNIDVIGGHYIFRPARPAKLQISGQLDILGKAAVGGASAMSSSLKVENGIVEVQGDANVVGVNNGLGGPARCPHHSN